VWAGSREGEAKERERERRGSAERGRGEGDEVVGERERERAQGKRSAEAVGRRGTGGTEVEEGGDADTDSRIDAPLDPR
jgi:hypothetical protein